MNKERLFIVGLIYLVIAIIVGVSCNNELGKKTIFECMDLNPDEIATFEVEIMDLCYSEVVRTEDKEKIKAIEKCLRKVKVKETDDGFNYEGPDKMFRIKDKNGVKYLFIVYGNVGYVCKGDEISKQLYKVYGYNSNELLRVCERLGLYED